MMRLTLAQLALWCDADLIGDDLVVQAIGTDTRSLSPGSLYVALRGENFDGHDFHAQAAEAGALALLVERRLDSALPQLVCANAQIALGRIAAEIADTRTTTTIGITGSNGKTTTRTLALAILKHTDASAYSNRGNRNNEIGVPLALIEQPETTRFGIYEMGAGAPGDIAYLAAIVRPKIALVTNIAPAHLERMGNLTGIADTKAAIYDALPDDGDAIINADDSFAPYFEERAKPRRILRYGLESTADIWAGDIVPGENGSRFVLHSPWGAIDITLPLPGRHQVGNALAAASLALAAGASLEHVAAGLAEAEGVYGRQQVLALPNGTHLLDDSYNANPGSLASAIDTLIAAATRRGVPSWLVLGDMRELGPDAAALHAQSGQRAHEAGVDRLFAVGDLSRHAAVAFGSGGEHFADQTALIEKLRSSMDEPVVILVKGSRGSRMDVVVAALAGDSGGEGGHAA